MADAGTQRLSDRGPRAWATVREMLGAFGSSGSTAETNSCWLVNSTASVKFWRWHRKRKSRTDHVHQYSCLAKPEAGLSSAAHQPLGLLREQDVHSYTGEQMLPENHD